MTEQHTRTVWFVYWSDSAAMFRYMSLGVPTREAEKLFANKIAFTGRAEAFQAVNAMNKLMGDGPLHLNPPPHAMATGDVTGFEDAEPEWNKPRRHAPGRIGRPPKGWDDEIAGEIEDETEALASARGTGEGTWSIT